MLTLSSCLPVWRPAFLFPIILVGSLGVATAQSFVFDTFGDGFWKIVNQANNRALVVNTNGATQTTTSTTSELERFQVLYNLENGTFRIRARDSWLCIGSQSGAATNGTPVVTIDYNGATSQQWNVITVGDGYYRIINSASGLALQTDGATPAQVRLAPVTTTAQQYWRFDYQTHYPKKGTAGYDGSWQKFGASWSYNWGRFGTTTPAAVVFDPMQWGQWWPNLNTLAADSVAWRQTAKPQHLLGFNEPDSSSQANVSVTTAISLWPQLQAANVPLVSPATVNPRNSWDNDFFNQIATNGYRVDYKAIHWYGSPNASSLINTLQNSYTAHGRPIWLTEFSTVDWNGTATWTEEDNYRFLAEFMWRAEDLVWLKRYAIFSFSGPPSVNPWDRNGHRSDVFESDGYTFTPFGELYATWDGDRTLRESTPYLLQNLSTSHRLGADSAGALSSESIRVRDAAAQWALLPATTSNHWYIVSLQNGRRLRTDGTTIDLAPPATTGTNLEWSFSGPDSNGYYFIDNPANSKNLRMERVNNSSGAPTSLTLSMYPFGNASDPSRWRFIKPYQPVPLGAVAPATNLTAEAWDRMAVLRWSGAAPRYNIYRSLTSGGSYSRIATGITETLYVDNSLQNSVSYYYVVTAVNGLEEEASYSNEATAMPSNAAANRLMVVYKFEGNAQDSSGNQFPGRAAGITYGAGRVDAQAAVFDGVASVSRIPAVVANDFSIAFWMKTTVTGTTGQWWAGLGIVDGEVSGVANDFGIALVGNKAAFGVGNPDTTITSTTTVNDGLWHHIVATRTAANGALRLYVDGVQQALGVGATSPRSAPPQLAIGSLQSGHNFFQGSLDEIRVYNYALNASEIAQLAKLGATIVASYEFEGNTFDSSGANNHGSGTNITFVPGINGTQAVQFDGGSSHIRIPASIADEFSISLWAKTTTTAGSPQWWAGKGLVDGEVSGATTDFGVALVANRAGFGVGNPDTTIVSTTPISDGQWHHIVATRSGFSGQMKLYVDGNLQSTTSGPLNSRSAPTALRIGGLQSGGGFFSGAVDEVRLFNYALNASQVAALYQPQSLPVPWQNQDIGNPWSGGYASGTTNGSWTLGGGGADIWQTSDQFHFASQNLSGPGNIVARVTSGAILSDSSTNTYSKAGIMFRSTAAANSPFVGLFHTQGQGLQLIYRDTAGINAGALPAVTINPPIWLKLVRSNETFTGYYATTTSTPSTNNWILLGNHDTVLATNALAGLAACAHDNTKLVSASYGNVTITPDTPGNLWRQQWFGTSANSGLAADNADPDADGFNNLWERAFNQNPLLPDTNTTPQGGLDGDDCTLTYRRNLAATDLFFQAQWSTNLNVWFTHNLTDTSVQTNGETELRIAKVPRNSGNPLFLRLQLSTP